MPQHQTSKPIRVKPGTSSSEAASFLASKVTSRSQTTLPSGVRKALGLRAGDQIAYEIEKDQVVIRKVIAEHEDPALDGFLDLLEKDIARHKDRVIFATERFANYLQELTVGIEVDYDAPIEGDFQL
jgi:antitoxin PrlF